MECKQIQTAINAQTWIHSSDKKQPGGKKKPRTRFMLQGWPLSAPRLPRPPGSPRLGQDSVGNFVWFGRAGNEQRRRGWGGSFWNTAEKRTRTTEARQCPATAPRFSGTEAAVSTTRHSPRAAGKCGRVEVEITRKLPKRPWCEDLFAGLWQIFTALPL